ncbi:MAG: multicopper oxidase domain-containing protein, partial [Anaerolineae bacterium]|nr:multicopper oxidase domain-containing protein [Anaerolineae bacterium]
MTSKRISRREFLRLFGMGGFSFVLSSCLPQGMTKSFSNYVAPLDEPAPDIEISLEAIQDEIQIQQGPLTKVWRYQGQVIRGPEGTLRAIPNSYLGPIITVVKGQTIRIHFKNSLPDESIIHWHGLHVP